MDLLRKEREDKDIARLLGIRLNYAGATRKQEDGKWLVSYHRIAALRTKLEVA
jgi:hypothetical protein